MSPTGKVWSKVEAGGVEPLASSHLPGDSPSSLPLRLSVAQGGLGLELCEPVRIGPLVIDELEVELPGLKYPIDLSKGVKQFRHRRSLLRRAVVRIDTDKLASAWASALVEAWGEGVKVRLCVVYEGEETAAGSRGHVAALSDGEGIPSLSVTIHRGAEALAFDLVLTSGTSPRVVVDAPRIVGRTDAPLLCALHSLDAGLSSAAGQPSGAGLSLARRGRAIEMTGLAEAVALLVLPSLGCRLPQVDDQVVRSVTFEKGQIRVELGAREQPFSAGRRGLWVAGAADLLLAADGQFVQGDVTTARNGYLDALESAPGHPEVLQDLADLDLYTGDRAESALSFLEELEGAGALRLTRQAEARLCLALARALATTGREQLVPETLDRYLALETDPVLSALVGVELAAQEGSEGKRRERLDRAVARAPFLRVPRRARFLFALEKGDLRTAHADAEHLEATESTALGRASLCSWVGVAFLETGRPVEAQNWLGRALRLNPDDALTMLRLARNLAETDEHLRAAELLQSAIRRFALLEEDAALRSGAKLQWLGGEEGPERLREHLSAARYLLAKLLLRDEQGAPMALAHLTAVETRASVGVEARLMEAEVHQKRGDRTRRYRAISRLLEAVEMGWVDLASHEQKLRDFMSDIEAEAETGDDRSLLEFAARVLTPRVD